MRKPSTEQKNNSLNRRTFLQSAAAGSLAMATAQAAGRRKITSTSVIRAGLIGRDAADHDTWVEL